MSHMAKYKDLKVLEETHIKFFQAKNLAEFKNEGKITVSEFLGRLIEPYFKKYDDSIIKKFE